MDLAICLLLNHAKTNGSIQPKLSMKLTDIPRSNISLLPFQFSPFQDRLYEVIRPTTSGVSTISFRGGGLHSGCFGLHSKIFVNGGSNLKTRFRGL